MILQGRVRVNGVCVRAMGTQVDPQTDRVEVNGRLVRMGSRVEVYLLYKPRGVVSTLKDPQGRRTLVEWVKKASTRLVPVGRLDYTTSGALLLTNDGELVNALLHPKKVVEKMYQVKVRGQLSKEELSKLCKGVVLDDGYKTAPARVSVLKQRNDFTWLQVTLTEGKNRQLRRMMEVLDKPVARLCRVTFAGVSIEGMKPGSMRPLTPRETTHLYGLK